MIELLILIIENKNIKSFSQVIVLPRLVTEWRSVLSRGLLPRSRACETRSASTSRTSIWPRTWKFEFAKCLFEYFYISESFTNIPHCWVIKFNSIFQWMWKSSVNFWTNKIVFHYKKNFNKFGLTWSTGMILCWMFSCCRVSWRWPSSQASYSSQLKPNDKQWNHYET